MHNAPDSSIQRLCDDTNRRNTVENTVAQIPSRAEQVSMVKEQLS